MVHSKCNGFKLPKDRIIGLNKKENKNPAISYSQKAWLKQIHPKELKKKEWKKQTMQMLTETLIV